MTNVSFNRNEYFSKTELLSTYEIPWSEFEEIFNYFHILSYIVPSDSYRGGKATYFRITDLEKIKPILKKQEFYFKDDFSIKLKSVFHEIKFPNASPTPEKRPVELFFNKISISNINLYKVCTVKEYRTTSFGGSFFMEKIEDNWSIVKRPGAPFWILNCEKEIIEILSELGI